MKKPSKHNVLKQLAEAKRIYLELCTEETRERLSHARSLVVQYKPIRGMRLSPERQLALARWQAEVTAAELALQQQLALRSEAFDRRVALVIDPEFAAMRAEEERAAS